MIVFVSVLGIYSLLFKQWHGIVRIVAYSWFYLITLQVFQLRMDGTVDIYRKWETYRRGFGDLEKEFWLGTYLNGMIMYRCLYFALRWETITSENIFRVIARDKKKQNYCYPC